jgi:hypothetical protein
MSDIAVSFEPSCSWDESNVIGDDATHCDCERMYDVDCGGLDRDELECHTIDHCRSCYITTSYYTGCYCEDYECSAGVRVCSGCEIPYDVDCGAITSSSECDLTDHCQSCYTYTPFADIFNGCYCEDYPCSDWVTHCVGCEIPYEVDCGAITSSSECDLIDHCQSCYQTTPYPDTYNGCYCENDDCADEVELCSGCEEHYDYLQDVTCTFDYYASARVLVTITDNSGRLYPVLGENGNVDYRPVVLNFYIISGNRNLLNPVTDTDSCEVQVVDLPEIGVLPGPPKTIPSQPGTGECYYCKNMKSEVETWDPDFVDCGEECCPGECPPDSVYMDVPYKNQCGEFIGMTCSNNLDACYNLCGPTSAWMMLKHYGIDTTIDDLVPTIMRGGSYCTECNYISVANTLTDKSGIEFSYNTGGSWETLTSELGKSKPIIVGNGIGYKDNQFRCYSVNGHVIVIVGYSNYGDGYVIVNDPYTTVSRCPLEAGERVVFPKDGFMDSWKERSNNYILVEDGLDLHLLPVAKE